MRHARAALVALSLFATTLAGCAGGDGALAMQVTVPDDPVTQPTLFQAMGRGERFLWDFNDGTGPHEGQRLEYVLGFTNGNLRVRLAAEQADGTVQTTNSEITLGTQQNRNPTPVMHVSTKWLTPGAPFVASGAETHDPDGDPLVFRWQCTFAGPLEPHPRDHPDPAGVPFGAHILGTVRPEGLPAPDREVEGDLCDALRDGFLERGTRDATISGSFQNTGTYDIRMEVRDPKGHPFVGQATVFVTDSIPPRWKNESFSGTLLGGGGGVFQDNLGDLGMVLDREVHEFSVDIDNRRATVTFTFSGDLPVPPPDVRWSIVSTGGRVVVPQTDDAERVIGQGQMLRGPVYNVIVTLHGGANVDYELHIEIEQDLQPQHLWHPPLGLPP